MVIKIMSKHKPCQGFWEKIHKLDKPENRKREEKMRKKQKKKQKKDQKVQKGFRKKPTNLINVTQEERLR